MREGGKKMNTEKIRESFPLLVRDKPPIYFDNACVTLKPIQVVKALNKYYKNYPACAGRSNHKLGNKVTEEYKKARETIAKFIGAKPKEVIFTRNTTEGLNLVANSLNFKKGDIVLTTDKEHNSNLLPWQILSKKLGIKHKIVFSKSGNTFDLEEFKKKMNKDVKLVSMVHTSNLDGVTIPAKEIIKIAHDYGSLVMLDAAQSIPHKELNVKKLDVDFLAFSGHKMLGPSGIGVLYGKYNLLKEMKPFLVGGDTIEKTTYQDHELLAPPEKFEAGLQNYAGTIGLAAAAKYLERIGKQNIERHVIELNKIITKEFQSNDKIKIIGPVDPNPRSGIISFNIEEINYHDVALMLDSMANIMVRSGQHCVHSWFNHHKIKGCVRASLYLYNTKEEVETFIKKINELVKLG